MSFSLDDGARKGPRVIAVLWPSFLVAALAEFAIFALLDPAAMQLPGGDRLVRPAAYTIGFFVFWALGALSSGLTLYFSQTATSLPPPDPDAP